MDTLGASLEQTQERTRQNETRIAEVDAKAESAGRSATTAAAAAAAAATAATEVETPVAPNTTRAGRAHNRRVVVRVLS